MESTATIVVKVSYGGVLRRFRVPVKPNGQLDLDMAGLREKIAALFNLPVDAEFSLTYSDEDGDVVALVDDNDLFDVTNQRLMFLRINVQLYTGLPTKSIAPGSNGSSTAAAMPNSQNTVSEFQKGINDVLMAVPNPMRDTISKVYMDLASKAAGSSPVVGEMLDCISKLAHLSSPQKMSPCTPVTEAFCGEGSSGPSLSREVPFTGKKKDVSESTQTGRKHDNLNVPVAFADSKTSGHVPTASGLGASFNECPFSGCTVNDSCTNPIKLNKHASHACHSKKSSNGDNWTSLGVFHKGIHCDGCGILPITGPRFKSKVKEDYDLCTICFSVMGNDEDYTVMDKPISVQHINPFRGELTQCSYPSLNYPVLRSPKGSLHFKCPWPKLDSRFVHDVNVRDGTIFAPSAPFSKIWKMSNNGSLVWPHGTQIVWIGGDRLSNLLSVDLQIPEEGAPINSELDVKVDFVAPESPGRYISYWMMASSNGATFGQRVWVLIHVDAFLKGSVVKEFHGLNLNASPDENSSKEFTGINVNPGLVKDIPVPLQEDIEKNDVEITLLKELEEMGFMEIDLNKEILRDHDYNLEQSVDILCGVSEWDPILEELKEMGFCDDVKNKMLLKKNNGSIKGVVMDLLAGDKKA